MGGSGIHLQLLRQVADSFHVSAHRQTDISIQVLGTLPYRLEQIGKQRGIATGTGTVDVYGDQRTLGAPKCRYPILVHIHLPPLGVAGIEIRARIGPIPLEPTQR